MMKRAKGEGIQRYSKSKPDDFLREVHTADGRFWTDRLPVDLALEAEGHPGLREQFWELATGRLDTMLKDIFTQMAGHFGLGFE